MTCPNCAAQMARDKPHPFYCPKCGLIDTRPHSGTNAATKEET